LIQELGHDDIIIISRICFHHPELLQHEIDHLDGTCRPPTHPPPGAREELNHALLARALGVLAVDRAETNRDLISRAVYDSMRDHFDAQVDYHITPTI
jgi:hypothetical protein